MEQFKSIGTKQCFVDALDKVTGKAKYLDDISFPGLLIGKILRSPHPHARILSIDTSEAEKLKGVRAVITAKDCPRNKFGMEIPDVDMLAVDKVRYVGWGRIAQARVKLDALPLGRVMACGGDNQPGNFVLRDHFGLIESEGWGRNVARADMDLEAVGNAGLCRPTCHHV